MVRLTQDTLMFQKCEIKTMVVCSFFPGEKTAHRLFITQWVTNSRKWLISLGRSFSHAKLEYNNYWCQIWSKVMTTEKLNAHHSWPRHQWDNFYHSMRVIQPVASHRCFGWAKMAANCGQNQPKKKFLPSICEKMLTVFLSMVQTLFMIKQKSQIWQFCFRGFLRI